MLVLISSLLFLAAAQPVPAVAESSEALIVLERNGDQIKITATFKGVSSLPDSLEYRLSVQRTGPSGTSTTRQTGYFATPTSTKTLSTTSINIGKDSRLIIRLDILHDEKIIAQDIVNKSY